MFFLFILLIYILVTFDALSYEDQGQFL